MHTLLFPL